MNPLQQREAMQKQRFEQEKADLCSKVMGTSGRVDARFADGFLQFNTGRHSDMVVGYKTNEPLW